MSTNDLAMVLLWAGFEFESLLLSVEQHWQSSCRFDDFPRQKLEEEIRAIGLSLDRVSARLNGEAGNPLIDALNVASNDLAQEWQRRRERPVNGGDDDGSVPENGDLPTYYLTDIPSDDWPHDSPLDAMTWQQSRRLAGIYVATLPEDLRMCFRAGTLMRQCIHLPDDSIEQDTFYGPQFPLKELEGSLAAIVDAFPALRGLDVIIEARCRGSAQAFHTALVHRMGVVLDSLQRRIAGEVPAEDGPWSKPDLPSQWAKRVFICHPRTLMRRIEKGQIRAKRLSSKALQIHVNDLPENC